MKDRDNARICVPVCERRTLDLVERVARAAALGDMVEVRLDCLEPEELESALADIRRSGVADHLSLIGTFRPAQQGGKRAAQESERIAFWSAHGSEVDYADVELDLIERGLNVSLGPAGAVNSLPEQGVEPEFNWSRVICSHHDFLGVPPDLEQIYQRMSATRAGILKIAVQVGDVTDCIPLFRLLARARGEGRQMIAIGMGAAGIATRILGPSRGAFLTYGSLDTQHATAPGQLRADELRSIYRADQLDQQTEIMGLIGDPVMHSVSPHMHNAAFVVSGMNAVYIPFQVRNPEEFMVRMARPDTREIEWRLKGMAVTAPHKTSVMAHLDWVDESARQIGAVNTIVIEDRTLKGYNTDGLGLIAPLKHKVESLVGWRCAIIGAGGAARSALWSLRREGATTTLFARRPDHARSLASQFDASCEDLQGATFDGFDVVVNATPLGTQGTRQDQTPATAIQLRGASIAYDLVYNPRKTRFLSEAAQAGCDCIEGLGMLVAQAAAQFRLWTGQSAPVELMHAAALRALEEQSSASAAVHEQ